jgi:hypothetical protein
MVHSAKVVVNVRRRLVCACVMLHTMVLVVREAKAQRRAAFHAPTKTAFLIVLVALESATRLLASVHALHRLDNSPMVLHARKLAEVLHMRQIGLAHLISGAGLPARTISC